MEKELFQRISRGDQKAFQLFFNRYRHKLYRFMLKVCHSDAMAEELVQDIFIKIWTNRAALASVEKTGQYLFVVARNKALDYLRKAARERELVEEYWERLEKSHNPTDELLSVREQQLLIDKALNQLSPRKQLIFHLSREEGLNHKAIASKLNISPSTVNNHLVHTLNIIRQYLQKHSPDVLLALLFYFF